jgi:hypothetical protein
VYEGKGTRATDRRTAAEKEATAITKPRRRECGAADDTIVARSKCRGMNAACAKMRLSLGRIGA